jgi:AraC-like DNA-binding protein
MPRPSSRSNVTVDSIRASALVGFQRLAGDLGGDPDALLRAAGIAPRHLESPGRRISYAAMIRLLEDSASQLHCPDFGLRLSGFQDINITGPAAMIALHSETVGDCLRAIATYFYVHASGGAVQLVPGAPGYRDLTFEILLPGLHAKRQINELTIGIGQRLLEMIVSPGFRSERIQFTHRRPDDTRALKRRFGPNLEFDCPVNAIALREETLARPVPTANAEFREVAIEYVRVHLGNAEENRVRRVTLLAHQLLPTGRCSLTSVAEILGVHPRTLQRELRAAGADFRGTLDQVRRELVTDYLRDTGASLGQIAAMLGYRDQAAFTNAFERWFGMPPGRWRATFGQGRPKRTPSRTPKRMRTTLGL